MSRYSGPQGKGASRRLKETKREEAIVRQENEQQRTQDRLLQEYDETGSTIFELGDETSMLIVHNVLFAIFGE